MNSSIAVVIPTVGRWADLERCLSSLEHQVGGPPATCICVLNGRTGAFPSDLVRPWVHVVLESRKSPGAARNAGLAAAFNDWVAFIDDDCTAPETWLDTLDRVVLERPQLAIAGGAVVEPERPGVIYELMRMLNYMRSTSTLKWRGDGVPSLGGANLLVRRSVIQELGGFDAGLTSSEDFELVLRAFLSGREIVSFHEDDPVVHAHTTNLIAFVRRYYRYGDGVAAVVANHRLDPAAHRVYVGPSVCTIAPAARRFAGEDAKWMSDCGSNVQLRHRLLCYVRAASWQTGAWRSCRLTARS